MGIWFIFLVPFFIIMAVLGNWSTNDEEEEEVGSSTYHGEKEVEGDDETNNEDGNKPKDFNTLASRLSQDRRVDVV